MIKILWVSLASNLINVHSNSFLLDWQCFIIQQRISGSSIFFNFYSIFNDLRIVEYKESFADNMYNFSIDLLLRF
jgi:hypothetical protein